jgi:hypothetical protein
LTPRAYYLRCTKSSWLHRIVFVGSVGVGIRPIVVHEFPEKPGSTPGGLVAEWLLQPKTGEVHHYIAVYYTA